MAFRQTKKTDDAGLGFWDLQRFNTPENNTASLAYRTAFDHGYHTGRDLCGVNIICALPTQALALTSGKCCRAPMGAEIVDHFLSQKFTQHATEPIRCQYRHLRPIRGSSGLVGGRPLKLMVIGADIAEIYPV